MRFTGQVKIPDLDYPGVPASVQVDGKQVELFVEGESLGRWSLVDVRAERLISSAFSLKLAGEEVTFIADQPTEFAYGGVEAMANVWAKHKTMRLPLRIFANSRSRQGTKPSRIPDLREAIEETLAGTSPTALEPAIPPVVKEASTVASLREATGRRAANIEPGTPAEDVSPDEDRGVETGPDEAEPIASRAAAEVPAAAARAGSEGLPDEHDPVPDSPDTPDAVLAEPETEHEAQPPATDSVFKQSVPWAKSEESETEDSPDPVEFPDPVQAVPPAPASNGLEQPLSESPEPDEGSAASGDTGAAPEPTVVQPGSVPWLAPPPDDRPDDAAATSPEPPSDDIDAVEEEVEPVGDPEYVVDLGVFEEDDRGDHDRGDEDQEIAPARLDDEEVAPQPMATAAARGGIMGAVRSAFVRNRVEHTHVYVEAPGGLGIKRQICADCGHISIGVE